LEQCSTLISGFSRSQKSIIVGLEYGLEYGLEIQLFIIFEAPTRSHKYIGLLYWSRSRNWTLSYIP
jgi:hypothetical protein